MLRNEKSSKPSPSHSTMHTTSRNDDTLDVSSGADPGVLQAISKSQGRPVLNATQVSYLQRTIGNQAVLRLVRGPGEKDMRPAQPPIVLAASRGERGDETRPKYNQTQNRVQRFFGLFKKNRGFESDKGLLDLGGGVKGEVGVEGIIKGGTPMYAPSAMQERKPTPIYTLPKDLRGFYHDLGDSKWIYVRIPYESHSSTKDAADLKLERPKNKNNMHDNKEGVVPKKKVKMLNARLEHKTQKGDLFPHEPTANDVNQRALGDCYFLAALAAVARTRPSHIKSMIGDNGDGTVSARFYRVEGNPPVQTFRPQYVTVRKSLVVDSDGDQLYQEGPALWPGLLVKAYAAWDGHEAGALPGFRGTYTGIAGGHSDISWQHILGRSTKSHRENTRTGFVTGAGPLADETLPGDLDAFGTQVQFAYLHDRNLYKGQRMFIAKYKGAELDTFIQAAAQKLATVSKSASDIEKILRSNINGMNMTVPGELMLKKFLPALSDDDVSKWIQYANANNLEQKAQEYAKLGSENASKGVDLDFMYEHMPKAGLSMKGMWTILGYCKRFMDGTPAAPHYSDDTLELYARIERALTAGRFVGLSTPDYGKGTGISGGESTDVVKGIAGGHAYEVVSVRSAKDGRKYVRVRNPWGNFGRAYNDRHEGVEIEAGEFDVELSDVRRYFSDISYSAPRNIDIQPQSVTEQVNVISTEVSDLMEMRQSSDADWIDDRLRELRGQLMALNYKIQTQGGGQDFGFSTMDIGILMDELNAI